MIATVYMYVILRLGTHLHVNHNHFHNLSIAYYFQAFSNLILLFVYSCVTHLLRNSAKTAQRDDKGFSSLHYAALNGNRNAVRIVG